MSNDTEADLIQKKLQNFSLPDYVVFVGMLVGCAFIGVFFAVKKKAKSSNEEDEYLMGGRNMSLFPVSMSLVASWISGITLLGTPTEMYIHGTEYMFIVLGFYFAGYAGVKISIPVFHDLQLSSTYQYLQLRYDKTVQLFGSVLFAFSLVCWLPIVIYVPALAFNQVTGINIHIVTPVVCLVCIFYTCVGGLKAVVWTDLVQTILMLGAFLLVVIKGTIDVGGVGIVWERNWVSGRLEFPSLEIDPTIRHSFFTLFVGGAVHFLQSGVNNQNMVQRYLTLATLSKAKKSLWIFIVGVTIFILISGYCGLLVYAAYYQCDPLTTGLAKAKDQLLPLFVMEYMAFIPGVTGIFVGGVFSAALSSLSTGLNSMSAVFLEDFVKPFKKEPLSETATKIILRGVVVIFGIICVGLVFVVEKLGTVLQLSMSLSSMTTAASFGIFMGGMLLPWINAKGVLYGSILSTSIMTIMVIGSQNAQANGKLVYLGKELIVTNCSYNYDPIYAAKIAVKLNSTISDPSEVFFLFRISYLFYTAFGGVLTMIFAVLISYCIGFNDVSKMNPMLFAPPIRRFMKQPDSDEKKPEEKELLKYSSVPVAQNGGG